MTSLRFGYKHTQICEAETSGTCTCQQVDVKLAGPGDLSIEPNIPNSASLRKSDLPDTFIGRHGRTGEPLPGNEPIRIHIGRFGRGGELLS